MTVADNGNRTIGASRVSLEGERNLRHREDTGDPAHGGNIDLPSRDAALLADNEAWLDTQLRPGIRVSTARYITVDRARPGASGAVSTHRSQDIEGSRANAGVYGDPVARHGGMLQDIDDERGHLVGLDQSPDSG